MINWPVEMESVMSFKKEPGMVWLQYQWNSDVPHLECEMEQVMSKGGVTNESKCNFGLYRLRRPQLHYDKEQEKQSWAYWNEKILSKNKQLYTSPWNEVILSRPVGRFFYFHWSTVSVTWSGAKYGIFDKKAAKEHFLWQRLWRARQLLHIFPKR